MSPRGGDSPGRQYERLHDEPAAAPGTDTSRTAPPGLELSRMESSVSMISSKADSPGGSPGGRRMPRRGSVRPHTHRSRTRSFFGSGDENERRREKEREKSFASMFDVLKLELDTSGNGEDDFVPVLMDLTFYDHKELVSSALGLLVRHFEQRTVLKNAGLQVMGPHCHHHLHTTTSTPPPPHHSSHLPPSLLLLTFRPPSSVGMQVQLCVKKTMIEMYSAFEEKLRRLNRLTRRRKLFGEELYQAALLMGQLTMHCYEEGTVAGMGGKSAAGRSATSKRSGKTSRTKTDHTAGVYLQLVGRVKVTPGSRKAMLT